MKKTLLTTVALAALAFTTSNAASIAWTTADISGVGDVSTIGSTVVAISNSATALNGTTVDVAGVTFTYDGSLLTGNFAGDVSGLTPTGDAGYDALIGTIDFFSGSNPPSVFTYTFDVAIGQEYLVQVWYADENTTGRVNTITGSGTDNVLQGNDYATGTFTADAITQLLEITTSGGSANNGVRLSGFQLRAIPEPSAYALLAGLVSLASVMIRRRR